MAIKSLLTEEDLDALRQFDTCMVSNAIETFGTPLRNTGFADGSIRCMFQDAEAPPMVGYAATARLRSGEPPIVGGSFHDRSDFWNSILEIPEPRILVLEDMDTPPGRGAFLGDMHAAILQALGCIGYLTNGAVRECLQCVPWVPALCRKCIRFSCLCPHLRFGGHGQWWGAWKSTLEICCTATSTVC
jgi:regulator of RNase E activity RraA